MIFWMIILKIINKIIKGKWEKISKKRSTYSPTDQEFLKEGESQLIQLKIRLEETKKTEEEIKKEKKEVEEFLSSLS
jgi:cation transport regulator ChaC